MRLAIVYCISSLGWTAFGANLDDKGVISILRKDAIVKGDSLSHSFDAHRRGKYSVQILLEQGAKAGWVNAKVTLGEQKIEANVMFLPKGHSILSEDGEVGRIWQRVYINEAGPCHLALTLPGYANKIAEVRLYPMPEGTAELGPDRDGNLVLPAKEATPFGRKLRYELSPKKPCIGSWMNEKDYIRWLTKINSQSIFDVTVYQGCGRPNGGSSAEVVIVGIDFEKRLPFTVVETEGFQDFVPVKVGRVEIPELIHDTVRVEIRAIKKAKLAVMDVQKVVLTKAE